MAWNRQTTIGQILDNPKLLAAVERASPGISQTPGVDMARNMTLSMAHIYEPYILTADILKRIEEEFAKID